MLAAAAPQPFPLDSPAAFAASSGAASGLVSPGGTGVPAQSMMASTSAQSGLSMATLRAGSGLPPPATSGLVKSKSRDLARAVGVGLDYDDDDEDEYGNDEEMTTNGRSYRPNSTWSEGRNVVWSGGDAPPLPSPGAHSSASVDDRFSDAASWDGDMGETDPGPFGSSPSNAKTNTGTAGAPLGAARPGMSSKRRMAAMMQEQLSQLQREQDSHNQRQRRSTASDDEEEEDDGDDTETRFGHARNTSFGSSIWAGKGARSSIATNGGFSARRGDVPPPLPGLSPAAKAALLQAGAAGGVNPAALSPGLTELTDRSSVYSGNDDGVDTFDDRVHRDAHAAPAGDLSSDEELDGDETGHGVWQGSEARPKGLGMSLDETGSVQSSARADVEHDRTLSQGNYDASHDRSMAEEAAEADEADDDFEMLPTHPSSFSEGGTSPGNPSGRSSRAGPSAFAAADPLLLSPKSPPLDPNAFGVPPAQPPPRRSKKGRSNRSPVLSYAEGAEEEERQLSEQAALQAGTTNLKRMSSLGLKLKKVSPAPWEMSDEEEMEPVTSPTSSAAASSSKGRARASQDQQSQSSAQSSRGFGSGWSRPSMDGGKNARREREREIREASALPTSHSLSNWDTKDSSGSRGTTGVDAGQATSPNKNRERESRSSTSADTASRRSRSKSVSSNAASMLKGLGLANSAQPANAGGNGGAGGKKGSKFARAFRLGGNDEKNKPLSLAAGISSDDYAHLPPPSPSNALPPLPAAPPSPMSYASSASIGVPPHTQPGSGPGLDPAVSPVSRTMQLPGPALGLPSSSGASSQGSSSPSMQPSPGGAVLPAIPALAAAASGPPQRPPPRSSSGASGSVQTSSDTAASAASPTSVGSLSSRSGAVTSDSQAPLDMAELLLAASASKMKDQTFTPQQAKKNPNMPGSGSWMSSGGSTGSVTAPLFTRGSSPSPLGGAGPHRPNVPFSGGSNSSTPRLSSVPYKRTDAFGGEARRSPPGSVGNGQGRSVSPSFVFPQQQPPQDAASLSSTLDETRSSSVTPTPGRLVDAAAPAPASKGADDEPSFAPSSVPQRNASGSSSGAQSSLARSVGAGSVHGGPGSSYTSDSSQPAPVSSPPAASAVPLYPMTMPGSASQLSQFGQTPLPAQPVLPGQMGLPAPGQHKRVPYKLISLDQARLNQARERDSARQQAATQNKMSRSGSGHSLDHKGAAASMGSSNDAISVFAAGPKPGGGGNGGGGNTVKTKKSGFLRRFAKDKSSSNNNTHDDALEENPLPRGASGHDLPQLQGPMLNIDGSQAQGGKELEAPALSLRPVSSILNGFGADLLDPSALKSLREAGAGSLDSMAEDDEGGEAAAAAALEGNRGAALAPAGGLKPPGAFLSPNSPAESYRSFESHGAASSRGSSSHTGPGAGGSQIFEDAHSSAGGASPFAVHSSPGRASLATPAGSPAIGMASRANVSPSTLSERVHAPSAITPTPYSAKVTAGAPQSASSLTSYGHGPNSPSFESAHSHLGGSNAEHQTPLTYQQRQALILAEAKARKEAHLASLRANQTSAMPRHDASRRSSTSSGHSDESSALGLVNGFPATPTSPTSAGANSAQGSASKGSGGGAGAGVPPIPHPALRARAQELEAQMADIAQELAALRRSLGESAMSPVVPPAVAGSAPGTPIPSCSACGCNCAEQRRVQALNEAAVLKGLSILDRGRALKPANGGTGSKFGGYADR